MVANNIGRHAISIQDTIGTQSKTVQKKTDKKDTPNKAFVEGEKPPFGAILKGALTLKSPKFKNPKQKLKNPSETAPKKLAEQPAEKPLESTLTQPEALNPENPLEEAGLQPDQDTGEPLPTKVLSEEISKDSIILLQAKSPQTTILNPLDGQKTSKIDETTPLNTSTISTNKDTDSPISGNSQKLAPSDSINNPSTAVAAETSIHTDQPETASAKEPLKESLKNNTNTHIDSKKFTVDLEHQAPERFVSAAENSFSLLNKKFTRNPLLNASTGSVGSENSASSIETSTNLLARFRQNFEKQTDFSEKDETSNFRLETTSDGSFDQGTGETFSIQSSIQSNPAETTLNPPAHEISISSNNPLSTTPADKATGNKFNMVNLPSFEGSIPEQTVDGVSMAFHSGRRELTIQLNPENLGELRIHLNSGADQQIHARLIASNAEAHQQLEKQVDVLREALQNQGLHVGNIRVVYAGQSNQQDFTRQDHNQNPQQLFQEFNQQQHHSQQYTQQQSSFQFVQNISNQRGGTFSTIQSEQQESINTTTQMTHENGSISLLI